MCHPGFQSNGCRSASRGRSSRTAALLETSTCFGSVVATLSFIQHCFGFATSSDTRTATPDLGLTRQRPKSSPSSSLARGTSSPRHQGRTTESDPSGEFQDLLPSDAIVECAADGSNLSTVLPAADADPQWEEKRVRARDLVHQRHGWEQRAKHIYERVMS